MPNILLTTVCNRTCPYCFAQKEMDGAGGDRMSWENLIYLADFLFRSGERRVSLLGGEPTLHPDFVDYVLYLLERGFELCVFTNGMVSEARLAEFREHLAAVSTKRLNFVCNLNDPEQTPASAAEARQVDAFLKAMGPWTTPGFNIYRPDFRLDFLFDLVGRHGLKRNLRLGLAHPLPGQAEGYIRPDQISPVIERLYSYRPLFDRLRVKPGLDCGFPLCKFDDAQLGWLQRLSGHSKFECGPAVDIGPDMSVYACFPQSAYFRKSVFDFDSFQQIVDYYVRIQAETRVELPGIYEACDDCVHRAEAACSGGGACQLLNAMSGEADIRMPGIAHEPAKNHLPV